MKTLINKENPAIRITAPEIIETSLYYVLDFANDDNTSETDLFKDNWTLVEEESKHTEVWVEGRTIFEQDAKKPVDLEKEIEKKWNECDSIDEGMGAEYANIVIEQFDEICKYFYELGQCEMRNRITNPEYNKQVVDKMKSEYPEFGKKGGGK